MDNVNWFQRVATKTTRLLSFGSDNYRPEKQGDSYFYEIRGGSVFDYNDYMKALEIPELANVINIRLRAFSSGIIDAYSISTDKPAPNGESLVRILREPNYFQAYAEFWRQSEMYRAVYGNEYFYFNTPFGMPNTYKGLFTLDPSRVTVEYNGDKRFFLEVDNENIKYYYTLENGQKYELVKENLIHLNDSIPDSKNFLLGQSKIEALKPALNNIVRAYEKRGIILGLTVGGFTKRTNDEINAQLPMDGEEKKTVEKKLHSKGAHPFITNLGVEYNAIVNNPTQMGLFEEVREDTTKICDAYGVPYEILANQKGTTFTNLKEAKKQMYEESIIPDNDAKLGAINNRKAKGKNWELRADFSHLPVFQEDKKQRAASYKLMVEALSKAYADGAIDLKTYQEELKNI